MQKTNIADMFITGIKDRLNKYNLNWMACITGPTGSGKSYSAISLANTIDPNFSVDKIVFDLEEFLEVLETAKTGDVIVWDEGGVGFGSRSAMTKDNRGISEIIQTFRYRNLGLIWTTPASGFVDKSGRILFHVILETQPPIDYKNEVVNMKWKQSKYSHHFNSIYDQYPVILLNGRRTRVKKVSIKKPPEELVEAYEQKKGDFNKKLLAQKRKEQEEKGINKKELKHKKLLAKKNEVIQQIQEEGIGNYIDKKGKINGSKIRGKFPDLSYHHAYKIKHELEESLN